MNYNIIRKLIRRLIVFLFILLICPILLFYYSKEIEPKIVHTNEVAIESNSVTSEMEGLKIVHFSDTHLGSDYSLEELQNLVKKINNQHPDLIVFTGDLIDNSNLYKEIDEIAPILSKLKATYGKFAVYGNHDVGGGGKRISSNVFLHSGFTLLENSSKTITLAENQQLSIVGLDDYLLGRPNPTKAFEQIQKDSFVLLMVHEPDVVDRLSNFPIDLQVSGHSHGGQVKLPFHKAIYTPPLAKKYTEGLYKIKKSSKPISLYVNRGIGTTRLPVRFFSRPELSIFTLSAKKKINSNSSLSQMSK